MEFHVITRWLAAGLWLLLIKTEKHNALDPACKLVPFDLKDLQFIKINNLILCELTNRAKLPTDFGENVEGLVLISSLNTVPVDADSPLKIPTLKFLVLQELISFNVPKDFFSMLPNLQLLSTEKVRFVKDAPQLPNFIKFLYIEFVEPPYDLSKLHNLEWFKYESSGLTEFPSIPSTAPLKTLSLKKNLLTNLTLPDIAQYCLLNETDLTSTHIQNSSERAYCELDAWFKSHNIKGTLSSGVKQLDLSKCNATVAENAEAVSRYKSCLRGNFWLYVVLIAVVIVLVVAIIVAVLYFRRRRK